MTTVLVTGAGGFLGSAVANDLLKSGYHVRALVRNAASSSPRKGLEIVVGDVRDPQCAREASLGCESVVHLAGKAHAMNDEAVTDEDYQAVNVGGTKHLLDGAVAGGVQRFIFASSVKVFGEKTAGCVDEKTAVAPQTAYARSKWMAEQLVASYSNPGDLATVSFRLPLVYGPTQKGNLYRMIAAIDQGRFPPLPPVPTLRSMLHVKNFVLAVRSALESGRLLQPMYVVTDAEPYSISTIYDLLRRGLGKSDPPWRVPLWTLRLAATCGDMLESVLRRSMLINSATLEKLIGPALYSSDAISRDLGYRPLYSFTDAVPDLIRHYNSALRC